MLYRQSDVFRGPIAKQAEDGARRCQAPALSVRPAKAEDRGAFLELARLCVADRCLPFREDQARYVFAGIGREDLCIYLLVAGSEAMGFSIVQSVRVPLTSVMYLREELLSSVPNLDRVRPRACCTP